MSAKRYTERDIEAAKASLSIVALAERGGVQWDARKSRPNAGEFWACCPFHAENSASFHVRERGPSSFFKCFGCGEKGDVFKLGQRLLGLSFAQMVAGEIGDASPTPELVAHLEQQRRERAAEDERQRTANRAAAVSIYNAAGVHVAGTLGELYLRRVRWIRAPLGGAELRFHSRAPLSPYEPAKAGRCPAMVARIRNADGEQIGSHLTFLCTDGSGKADLPHLKGSRMICGEHVGGFVRLGYVRDAAVIGEGVETTLSASEACGLPGLAAINSANLRALVLPSQIKRVVIAFDRDPKGAGELSADALAQRLWSEGRAVEMLPPPEGFKDWNDAAKAGALPKLEACA